MNLVDSSGWLEYVSDGPNASYFSKPLENAGKLIVPSICIFEVFKRITQQRDKDAALQVVAVMQQGHVIPLDEKIAIHAAQLSLDLKIPMADSIILATGQLYEVLIWTQDADFKDIPGVKFFPKAGGK